MLHLIRECNILYLVTPFQLAAHKETVYLDIVNNALKR